MASWVRLSVSTGVQYTGMIRLHRDGFYYLGGGFIFFKCMFPIFGDDPILTHIFQLG